MSTNNYVYAKLDAECLSNNKCSNTLGTDESKVFSVIMRFDDMDQYELVSDHLFDTAIGSFNSGLPEGWAVDENPETDRMLTEEEAKDIGYVIYEDN